MALSMQYLAEMSSALIDYPTRSPFRPIILPNTYGANLPSPTPDHSDRFHSWVKKNFVRKLHNLAYNSNMKTLAIASACIASFSFGIFVSCVVFHFLVLKPNLKAWQEASDKCRNIRRILS